MDRSQKRKRKQPRRATGKKRDKSIPAKPPKRPRGKPPEPIRPVSVGWHPPAPEMTQIPLDCPSSYPSDLWPQTRAILTEARQRFPEQRQMLDLCKYVFSQAKMGPIILSPVRAGKMKPHEAHTAMVGLLRSMLSRNKAHDQESEITISDGWTALERAIADVQHKNAETDRLVTNANQAEPSQAERLSGTIESLSAARCMEKYLESHAIGQTQFAIQVSTTDRTLRSFRRTGRVRRDIFERIAKAMGIEKETLLKPE